MNIETLSKMDPELIKALTQAAIDIVKWIIITSLGFIVAQIWGYFKMKGLVVKILSEVRELKREMSVLKDKIHDEYVEHIFEESEIKDRLGKVEGRVDGLYLPKAHKGHA